MADPRDEMDEEPAVFIVEEAVELDARDRKAMADIEAGRFVSHEAVMRWVRSWGTPNPLPRPKWGEYSGQIRR